MRSFIRSHFYFRLVIPCFFPPLVCRQLDDAPLKALKILSQSTDSLNKMGKVNESTESLADEGTDVCVLCRCGSCEVRHLICATLWALLCLRGGAYGWSPDGRV